MSRHRIRPTATSKSAISTACLRWSVCKPQPQTILLQETSMEHDSKSLNGLIGPQESTRILGELQRGASRRDVLAMLVAGGMQAALAGGIAGVATSAHAQTP